MGVAVLEATIQDDLGHGHIPFLVVGAAGTVSTGAVDPLDQLADICHTHGAWFHVDGAYGAPAIIAPEASASLRALSRADSVAMDPHKWLYAPLEAGCALVRDPTTLLDAFSHRPSYYHFDQEDEQFLSNAVVRGDYLLRSCIVNFRTSQRDIEAIPGIVTRLGNEADGELRPSRQ
jgi:glutamate/tyrosine decarboxylase-like PLP-dependent enzyme